MKNVEMKTFVSDLELAKAAANLWLNSVSQNPAQSVALSGGGIARLFFREIAERSVARKIPLSQIDFFWADERCVPPTDPESNFALANELLFQPLKIAPEKIHRLRGELKPEAAVAEANAEIEKIVLEKSQGQPVIDFIFLGMGPDGHVASLFPNAAAETLDCAKAFLHIDNSPKPPPKRLSLSYAAISPAKEVWVLASGKGKEQALRESLDPTCCRHPVGRSDANQTASSAPNLSRQDVSSTLTPLARVLKSRTQTRIFTDVQIA